jgi:hypothetical protein
MPSQSASTGMTLPSLTDGLQTRISHKLDEKVDIVNRSGNDGVKFLHQSDESMRIAKIIAPQ